MAEPRFVVPRIPEPTMQDALDAIQEIDGRVRDAGVEIERIKISLENITKLIENVQNSIDDLSSQ